MMCKDDVECRFIVRICTDVNKQMTMGYNALGIFLLQGVWNVSLESNLWAL